ncbi:hypothetical protein C6A86_014780 [Mycobacterium sp. ITM-2016-00316]|uniref:hypothetical protein n=1 Tax=Mycobacterium sp. ITM-2016-00316 TaxID=2099695 RepID=UPI000CFA3E4E|nr:hypothetical protein [Mycobacterium sp. ITM-2016-00316]WNG79572.1 hypothetical protein C6A86_014780 [Mycobacterium sp. ITM-2016-00316]
MGFTKPMITAAGLAFAGLIAAGPAVAEPAEPAPPAPPVSSEPAPDGPPAAPLNVIDKDGTYQVGTDIVPGVYASAGPFPEGTCSWRRMAPVVTEGEPGETLDRAFTKQPQIVEIKADDGSFKTTGCQTWTLTNQPPPAPGMSPVMAALQWKLYMDTLNRNAAQFEANPPQPAPAPPVAPGS